MRWCLSLKQLLLVGLSGLLCSTLYAKEVTRTLRFSGSLVNPANCTIDNYSAISVWFGDDVGVDRINGYNFMRNIPFSLTCTGSTPSAMKYRITGNQATIGGRLALMDSRRPGFGIALFSDGGDTKMNPGTWYNFYYWNPPVLMAAPIKNENTEIESGRFTVDATLAIEYQ